MKRSPLRRTAFITRKVTRSKLYRPKSKPAALKSYWSAVAAMGCIVTGARQDVTIHHVHGGSVRGIIPRGRGMKLDWFVLPLCADYHTGNHGIDGAMSVPDWEARYGTQLTYLLMVMRRTGVDPFAMSGMPWPEGIDRPDVT